MEQKAAHITTSGMSGGTLATTLAFKQYGSRIVATRAEETMLTVSYGRMRTERQEIGLAPQEEKLLRLLMIRYPRITSSDMFVETLYSHREDGGPLCANNVVKQVIHRIRYKLKKIDAGVSLPNRYNFGWTLE